MTKTDKAALAERLRGAGMVTPTLSEGQQVDTVRDIDTITGEILEAKRVGGEAILTIGQRLIEAKALLSDGEWLSWLAEKVDFSPRTAQRFMRLAREWSDATTLSHLGASKALALLALPESEREGFIAENHVEDMTARELAKAIKERDKVIKERDEARWAEEQAKADSRAAEEERKSLMESIKAANAMIDLAKADKEQAIDKIAALEQQLAVLKAAPVDVAVMKVDQEALDKARAEGEAAKAEEVAQLQAKLDKAKEAKAKSDDKRKDAEATVEMLKQRLEAADKAQKSAAALADPDVARFEIYFDQAQEAVNKLRGLLLKARKREDQAIAEKLSRTMVALSEKIKEAAR